MTIGWLRSIPCSASRHHFFDRDCANSGPWHGVARFPRCATSVNSVRTGPGQSADTSTPGAAQFAPQRFGETGHVSLGRGVNRKVRNRQKASRRTHVQNRAALCCDHSRKKPTRQPRQRDHVYLHHVVDALRIRRGKRAEIAETGVVDQQIDRGLRVDPARSVRRPPSVATDRSDEFPPADLDVARSVRRAIPPAAPSAARPEHERRGATAELAGELAPDSGRSAGDQGRGNRRVASRSLFS